MRLRLEQTPPTGILLSPAVLADWPGQPLLKSIMTHDLERHFRTDHLMADLKGRSFRGGAVTLSAQAVKFVLQLGSTVVLARLLTPEDFGLVAMVTAVTGFVALFMDLGLSQATVQRAEINHAQVSTLFWINVGVSVAMTLCVATLAPLLARLYEDSRLTGIALAVGATWMLRGIGAQHSALLVRQMQFTRLALIELMSLVAGILVALLMAWRGLGYWSIVGMLVLQSGTATFLYWRTSSWRPGRPVRGSGIRPMLRFGGHLAGFSILNYLSRNADDALVGWYWGATALGVYSRAYQLLLLPLSQINWPLSRVVIPTLSRLLDRPQEYREQYLGYVSITLWLTLPLVAVLAGSARSVVLVLLGEQWKDVIDVFRILCITAAVQPIYSTIGWIFVSTGRTDRFLRWALLSTPLFLLSFMLGLPHGVTGVALAYSLAFMLMLPWTMRFALRDTAVTGVDLLRALGKPASFALLLFVSCGAIDALVPSPGTALLFCAIAASLAAAAVVSLDGSLRRQMRCLLASG